MNDRKKKSKGYVLHKLIYSLNFVVFLIAAVFLWDLFREYYMARNEYKTITQEVVIEKREENTKKEDDFYIDWEKLLKQNPDVVGWIRFYPEPHQISYPILQGNDNEEYLHKTVTGKVLAAGSIFLNSGNRKDFTDFHSVVFGHRMRDGSMFRRLSDYENKEFFEKYPYFYIYLPTGEKRKYLVYGIEIVKADSPTYRTVFENSREYLDFLEMTKEKSMFTRTLSVGKHIVTLSTCTAASDEHRLVVRGIELEG